MIEVYRLVCKRSLIGMLCLEWPKWEQKEYNMLYGSIGEISKDAEGFSYLEKAPQVTLSLAFSPGFFAQVLNRN